MTFPLQRVVDSRAAVIFDRDGVLNRSLVRDRQPFAPTKFEEFELLPGAIEATSMLSAAGFKLIVATNQPDAGVGRIPKSEIEAMHALLMERIDLNGIYVCYHVDAHMCDCRKPKPGMLFTAAGDHDIDLSQSYMVGDRWRDVLAGAAAKCRTVLIDYNYDEPMPTHPDIVVNSIGEAAMRILSEVAN